MKEPPDLATLALASADRRMRLVEEITLPDAIRDEAISMLLVGVKEITTFDDDEVRAAHKLVNRGYQWARESKLTLRSVGLPPSAQELLDSMIGANEGLVTPWVTVTNLILRSRGPFMYAEEGDETLEDVIARELNAAGVRTNWPNAPGMSDAFVIGATLRAAEQQVVLTIDRLEHAKSVGRAQRWDWLPWRRPR